MTAPQYYSDKWTVPANGSIEIARMGEFLFCQSATLPFQIQFDNQPPTSFNEGVKFRTGSPFNKVRIRNPNASPITVQIAIGTGDVSDESKVITGSVNTREEVAAGFNGFAPVTVPAGQAAQIAPENLGRVEVIITNNSETDAVWLRPDNTAAAGGLKVRPLGGAVLGVTGAVYAYNEGTAAVEISAIETVGA